jgi:hypothetical protein
MKWRNEAGIHMETKCCGMKIYYSLRPILLFVNTNISTIKMCLDISTLAKSIMGRREYSLCGSKNMNETAFFGRTYALAGTGHSKWVFKVKKNPVQN